MKTCIACEITKPLTDFPIHRGFTDGRRSTCKKCFCVQQKSDLPRFIRKIYATQKLSSALRSHPAPSYTLKELTDWANKQPQLTPLWEAYQASGHLRDLAPSIDRVNSNLPYTLDNLELVTWEVNNRRGTRDTKAGTKITQHKAVAAYNKDGSLHKTYVSLHEAARDTQSHPTTIQRIADAVVIKKSDGRTTVLKTSRGFKWKWHSASSC